MTSQHNTGTHPFYIGMYIHICTHIYVHIYTSQKECLCIFSVSTLMVGVDGVIGVLMAVMAANSKVESLAQI